MSHQSEFSQKKKKKVQIRTFGRLTSHLGMSFQDNGLATLILNNHHGLKIHKTLEMLDLFGLKILFSMKIKFNFIIFLEI